ncbi:phenylalanyl-tRNA synthetase beta subunit [Nitrosomonas aestuarii]|uniref:Phenylalanine--tRNA ligase beta subunit n=1 Tax=Nitrosomonas aestuarii TaxID=52441 RepID=A0A1I4DS23_9PROT|nr:phenylalanine--tRNA ligase subunit beta [Nitrosomonas aestuarii]SFK96498.1 phenylalanyl-tRNA synthetase beta subunit [Nitrosomonas aestuarii]
MKFSENWLRTFVNPSCSSNELAHILTMAGIEVENVESISVPFERVVVAEVLSVERHPDADRLSVCLVNAGELAENPLQIVCGAPNVQVGIKVPCALVGSQLSGIVIKKTKLRGIESFGMLCSARELGISEDAAGLLLLPETAPVGQDFRKYYALDDNVFTLSLTPNRADCLGVYGVAREISAVTNTKLTPLRIEPVQEEIEDRLDINIHASKACPLYCGRIIRGIKSNVETPLWMEQRLERSGLRSINAVVDITNYVLLETGQPMHAFDLAKLDGHIHVRYAKIDETIQLLNENRVELTSDMLLISDDRKPLALAGIMGGSSTGVAEGTVDIFLECAFFDPDVISGKSFLLGFSSDSAYRFERGVDFAATHSVLEHATALIKSICGGKAGPINEIRHQLPQRRSVSVRTSRVQRVLGITLDRDQISEYFTRQQFDYSETDGVFTVIPPSYRFDLAIEEDFIEELARIHGYDEIAAQLPSAGLTMLAAPESLRVPAQIKQMLVMRDYQEVVNYAFVDKVWETDLIQNKDPIALKNPIASNLNVMRSSLLGGLIANLQFNLNRKQDRVRLFEMGCCFERNSTGHCQQIERLAGLGYGDVHIEQWGEPSRTIDFYDVKSDIEVLYRSKEVEFQTISHPAFHPGKSAQVMMGAKPVGWLGELHPHWQKKYDIAKPVILFELILDSLVPMQLMQVKETAKFPPVRRDIAVVVDNQINVQSIISSLYEKKPAVVTEIALFDIYRGKSVGENKKSLAFRVILQDVGRTLTDEDADLIIANLLQVLATKFDAILRN